MTGRVASLEKLLASCTPSARELVDAARQRILELVPHAHERFRPGWGILGYNAPAYFAFITAQHNRVRIGFEWGVLLSDDSGVLEGAGAQVRYAPLRSPVDLHSPLLGALICEAADLRPPRRARHSRAPS